MVMFNHIQVFFNIWYLLWIEIDISERSKRLLDSNYVNKLEYTKLEKTYSLPEIILVVFVFPAIIL